MSWFGWKPSSWLSSSNIVLWTSRSPAFSLSNRLVPTLHASHRTLQSMVRLQYWRNRSVASHWEIVLLCQAVPTAWYPATQANSSHLILKWPTMCRMRHTIVISAASKQMTVGTAQPTHCVQCLFPYQFSMVPHYTAGFKKLHKDVLRGSTLAGTTAWELFLHWCETEWVLAMDTLTQFAGHHPSFNHQQTSDGRYITLFLYQLYQQSYYPPTSIMKWGLVPVRPSLHMLRASNVNS